MSLYTYIGPLSAATLQDGTDVVLFPGGQVELPDDLPFLVDLNGMGVLVPVATEPAAPSEPEPKSKKGGA
jgi:hypothetical protein